MAIRKKIIHYNDLRDRGLPDHYLHNNYLNKTFHNQWKPLREQLIIATRELNIVDMFRCDVDLDIETLTKKFPLGRRGLARFPPNARFYNKDGRVDNNKDGRLDNVSNDDDENEDDDDDDDDDDSNNEEDDDKDDKVNFEGPYYSDGDSYEVFQ